MMKLKISGIIYFLIIYMPLEILFLKYLPITDFMYGYLRFFAEIIIYFLGAIILIRSITSKTLPLGTKVDKLFLIFIGYSLLITIVNHAPVVDAFVGLRGLLRYVPLFYVLAFVKIEKGMPKRYLNLLIFIAIFQSVIVVFQHFNGIADFWFPRGSDLEIGGKHATYRLLTSGFAGGREQGAGIGTFGDSVPLALFLVIVFVVVVALIQVNTDLGSKKKTLLYGLAILIFSALFYTYSRGSVLIALLTIPMLMYLTGKRKKIVLLFIFSIFLLSPLVMNILEGSSNNSTVNYINPKLKYTDPFSNVLMIFNSKYVDNTLKHSRGFVLTEIGSELLEGKILLGYSPAQIFALEKAAEKMFGSNTPINNLPVINDVYWIAFVIYYGIAGLVIFMLILYRIFTTSLYVFKNSTDTYMKVFALSMAAIVIISIPYSMIIRTFMFRSFGFYFWMIGGIVFAEWRRLKYVDNMNIENPEITS
jgi:hypothetical protein